jgi:hypothetical protein
MFGPAVWWRAGATGLEERAAGRILDGRAATAEAARRATQAGREGVRALARRHNAGPAPSRIGASRTFTADATVGPEAPRPAVLSPEDDAGVAAFRRRALLPLDDRPYYAL